MLCGFARGDSLAHHRGLPVGWQERHEAETTHAVREEEEAEEARSALRYPALSFIDVGSEPAGGRTRHRARQGKRSPGPVPLDESEILIRILMPAGLYA